MSQRFILPKGGLFSLPDTTSAESDCPAAVEFDGFVEYVRDATRTSFNLPGCHYQDGDLDLYDARDWIHTANEGSGLTSLHICRAPHALHTWLAPKPAVVNGSQELHGGELMYAGMFVRKRLPRSVSVPSCL